jgi:predicted DNA-binding protein
MARLGPDFPMTDLLDSLLLNIQRAMIMPRGRPQKDPARALNVRVEVSDLEKLALLQTVTGRPTAEVVRAALKDYIAKNEDKLRQAGSELAEGTYWERRSKG